MYGGNPRPLRGVVEVKTAADYFLRPPAWAERSSVEVRRGGAVVAGAWGGPQDAYVVCRAVKPGERLGLRWAVPRFAQTFVPRSVPGRNEPVTVTWTGNTVTRVSPAGRYLPMYEEQPSTDSLPPWRKP